MFVKDPEDMTIPSKLKDQGKEREGRTGARPKQVRQFCTWRSRVEYLGAKTEKSQKSTYKTKR
ncbi:hypothetical protein BY996DRAFT_6475754 [Phakopsora pachyrhizi]|nr:hypothetical protein BY996DRAFT_6475754 [Phakopsora pachyrhizi]